LISFFFFLCLAEWLSSIVFRAGIIGPIIVGIIYGMPLADILLEVWQETFLAIGYIGLILIIFEGGLTTRMDLLKQNFFLSMLAAMTGVVFPIGLSYIVLYIGFGYGAVETFIIGAALSTTSLGTTFAVIGGASKDIDLSQTRIGSVLVSAAVIDDVSGLVMSSVIHDLGTLSAGRDVNLGWLIGRPILASMLMATLTPLLCKYVFAPIFRRFIEHHFAKYDHLSNVVLMVLVLCAFISIAAYAGTSVLFGAFLSGSFLTYLPSKHPEGPFVVYSREHGEKNDNKSPTFVHTFEKYFSDVQKYLMEPLFFASIGFAIPFIDLWTGSAIWHGIVYTLLMLIAKVRRAHLRKFVHADSDL
jgi:Kef-type K+ transport system membrane component KefB